MAHLIFPSHSGSKECIFNGHIERMDKSFWVSRCRAVEVSGSASRGRQNKTWEEVIKMDLRERRVSKDLARDRLAWKSIF